MPLSGDVPEISMGGTEFQETVLTSGIGNIPPDDIESITVLKDAAATAIYGSRDVYKRQGWGIGLSGDVYRGIGLSEKIWPDKLWR